MYLKRLEISGFKSFANKSVLEFKKGVSGVVGPNGSGKSNIADAVRWVMGEQGMKALRSKKGEDLIFNGSSQKSAAGKAHVSLYFDNSDRVFPMEFEEISVTRKIFRDGETQYFINDSPARLRDILELIAKAKLGLRGYTIINQGMGDFVLNASPKERREIFEDALGLKEFQIKKVEAKNKLELTKVNLVQTNNLIAEIGPHLKFLKRQVEKIQQKEILEKSLEENEKIYFGAKLAHLEREKNELLKSKEDIERILSEEGGFMAGLKESIEKNESQMESFFDQEFSMEKELEEIVSKKSSIERELGKIEGVLAYKQEVPKVVYEPINLPYLNSTLKGIYHKYKEVLDIDTVEGMRAKLQSILADFDLILGEIESGIKKPHQIVEEKQEQKSEAEPLLAEKEKLVNILSDFDNQVKLVRDKMKDLNNAHRTEKDRLYNSKKELYERESHHEKLKQQVQSFDFRMNRILADLELVRQEAEAAEGSGEALIESNSTLQSHELEALKNEIEKVRIRLEVMENIDPEIQKEYDETEKRYEFLTREVDDLNRAIISLGDVIISLENKIDSLFSEAFIKIDAEFNRYFSMLFDGGKANLTKSIPVRKSKEDETDEEDEEVAEEGGIDIRVDMPRKKVKDIHLLSGGERALTSIALIFALVSCSPPPFLILDEIDAPLDESNALRFGRILEELRSKTQFIVITHNRETMKQADVLFGVTMSEDGVSKLFSVNLDGATKDM